MEAMEIDLRQRIIGAVVLVALAVIFLPLLFKGSENTPNRTKSVTLSAQIPPEPTKPVSAPQTIVMIKNKDLNTPAADNTNTAMVNTSSTSRMPIILPGKLTSAAASNNTVAPAATQTNTTKSINFAENETLSPPVANNDATAVNKRIRQPAAGSAKPTVKTVHEKIKEKKPITAESKLAKTSHKPVKAKLLAKKQSEVKHHAKATKTAATPKKTIHKKISPNKPKPAGATWEVRLGSFANDANAKDLVKQLRARGFKAYTQSIQSSMGSLTRVVIGPETNRKKADTVQTLLAKELNIKSEVVPFTNKR